MQCPKGQSTHIRKNGFHKQGKQNHICVVCGRQFIKDYNRPKGYKDKTGMPGSLWERKWLTPRYANG
jgi:transposase-like protein